MPNLIWVAGRLPLPKERSLALQASLIDRAYRKDIQAARSSKNYDKARELEQELWEELGMIEEERNEQYTKRLLRTARQLRVPIPRLRDEEGGIMPDWEQGHRLGYLYLSESGIAKVREAIRSEARWNQEQRAHWAVWLSAVTGLVGALTGLLAILNK